jgi:predicted metal-dependent HD superfamily phosphohydrolase
MVDLLFDVPADSKEWLWRYWQETVRPLALSPHAAQAQFDQIAAQYGAPERHYHNLNHLVTLFQFIEYGRAFSQDLTAVRLAGWFHDIVYDSRAADNEARSAAYATAVLTEWGAGERLTTAVTSLIQYTRDHQPPPDDPDARLLLDADLAILAAPPPRYAAYAAQIRREYGWVAEPIYRTQRRLVMAQFLARPQIYRLPFMSHYEPQARQNMQRELAAYP